MDKAYAETVRLLLDVAPVALQAKNFALKGGTAINLFVRDMPRLSVDLDLVWTDWTLPREEALAAIAAEVDAVAGKLSRAGMEVRAIRSSDAGDTTILVSNRGAQVKVEVNTVFRGTVRAPDTRTLCPRTAQMFQVDMNLRTLAVDELYGSKLVAAMDRQHPRDLFDVLPLMEAGRISEDMLECFVVYLAGHGRPVHEVLFGKDKDISVAYQNTFVGMTTDPVELEELLEARRWMRRALPAALSHRHREFLASLTTGTPDWALLSCPHASELPAVRWKLANLEVFRKRRPEEFRRHTEELERGLRNQTGPAGPE